MRRESTCCVVMPAKVEFSALMRQSYDFRLRLLYCRPFGPFSFIFFLMEWFLTWYKHTIYHYRFDTLATKHTMTLLNALPTLQTYFYVCTRQFDHPAAVAVVVYRFLAKPQKWRGWGVSVSDFKLLLSDVNDPTAISTIEHNVSVDYIFFHKF